VGVLGYEVKSVCRVCGVEGLYVQIESTQVCVDAVEDAGVPVDD